MRIIDIKLAAGAYVITIEAGALATLGAITLTVAAHGGGRKAMLVVDEAIAGTHGVIAAQSLAAAGLEVVTEPLHASESRKTLGSVRLLYEAMMAARLERGSVLVAMGGGIVGDVAGFAAATYMRGIPLVQVPTTLLAMVDASIGGKTGVNLELGGHAGEAVSEARLVKNLIGAFWQPRAVVIDPRVLRTLPPREFRCGLAECIKHELLSDRALLKLIAEQHEVLERHDDAALADLIGRSVRIKAAIVQRDERESGERALLNLGHTFAHAMESVTALGLKHGEAVAIGLCAAMGCAASLGRVDAVHSEELRQLIESVHLPSRLPRPVPLRDLMLAMTHDKKVADGRARLILPRREGGADIVNDVADDVIRAAWRSIGAAP
jgi:3-dehydroquinate synthase